MSLKQKDSTSSFMILLMMLVVGLNCAEEECMLLIVLGKLRVLLENILTPNSMRICSIFHFFYF